MKRLVLFFLLIPFFAFSQEDWGNLYFKSADGTQFKLSIDGKEYTSDFVTEAKAEHLPMGAKKVKITDKNSLVLEKKVFVAEPYSNTYYEIKVKKGKLKLRKKKVTYFRPYAPCTGKTDDLTVINFIRALSAEPNTVVQLENAKKFVKANCLTMAQATEISRAFKNEADRLWFLEYAYIFVSDPQNYVVTRSALGNSYGLFELYVQRFE